MGRWVGASKTFVFVLRKDGGMRKMIAKVGYQILSQNDNFDCGDSGLVDGQVEHDMWVKCNVDFS